MAYSTDEAVVHVVSPATAPVIVATQTLFNYNAPSEGQDVDLAFADLSNPVSIVRYRMQFAKA